MQSNILVFSAVERIKGFLYNMFASHFYESIPLIISEGVIISPFIPEYSYHKSLVLETPVSYLAKLTIRNDYKEAYTYAIGEDFRYTNIQKAYFTQLCMEWVNYRGNPHCTPEYSFFMDKLETYLHFTILDYIDDKQCKTSPDVQDNEHYYFTDEELLHLFTIVEERILIPFLLYGTLNQLRVDQQGTDYTLLAYDSFMKEYAMLQHSLTVRERFQEYHTVGVVV
jgi:hypothetical protein